MAVFNFFPVQKLIFGHLWNCKNWNLVKKFFLKLIYLISLFFLDWTFLNFLAYCVIRGCVSHFVLNLKCQGVWGWILNIVQIEKIYIYQYLQKTLFLSFDTLQSASGQFYSIKKLKVSTFAHRGGKRLLAFRISWIEFLFRFFGLWILGQRKWTSKTFLGLNDVINI